MPIGGDLRLIFRSQLLFGWRLALEEILKRSLGEHVVVSQGQTGGDIGLLVEAVLRGLLSRKLDADQFIEELLLLFAR